MVKYGFTMIRPELIGQFVPPPPPTVMERIIAALPDRITVAMIVAGSVGFMIDPVRFSTIAGFAFGFAFVLGRMR